MHNALFMQAAESAKSRCTALETELAQKQAELKGAVAFAAAMRGLRRSWSDGYPGKYGAHWFFVRSYAIRGATPGRRYVEYDKFWIADIVDEPAKARTLAQQGKISLGEFADARSAECPTCGLPATVIGRYEQTEDSFAGDTWETQIAALCLRCSRIVDLGADHTVAYHT